MTAFQATSDKSYKIGKQFWRIAVSAGSLPELAEAIQELETWESDRKQKAKLAKFKPPSEAEIVQILEEAGYSEASANG